MVCGEKKFKSIWNPLRSQKNTTSTRGDLSKWLQDAGAHNAMLQLDKILSLSSETELTYRWVIPQKNSSKPIFLNENTQYPTHSCIKLSRVTARNIILISKCVHKIIIRFDAVLRIICFRISNLSPLDIVKLWLNSWNFLQY